MESSANRSSAPPPRPTINTTGEMRQLGAGKKLGRYTLLRRIASGGMAEVYAARSHGVSGFEKKVAIKKILPQYSMNERFVDMLVDEAKIAVTLTHPNIAQIYELGLEDDTYYIVMEFVDGRPLNRLLQKVDARGHRTIPIEHAVHVVAEVSKGLYHAHEQRDHRGQKLGIVHRDVSPQNVMLAYTGDVKLIDFGIARAQGRAAQTNAGTIKGKLRYLAPEIAQGLEPDHRADVYCCGIVLFELLTGEALYAPRTDVEAIEMASKGMVRSPRLSTPEVPVELEEIVMRALKRDRDERYSTAKALSTDLRRFLNAYSPAFVGSELGDYMHALFAPEIDEERRLDAFAEKVLAENGTSSVPPPPAPRATLELEVPPMGATKSGGYREIVSRTDIALDKTPAMISVPPDTQAVTVHANDTKISLPPLLPASVAKVDAPPSARPRRSYAPWVVAGLGLALGLYAISRPEPIAPVDAPIPASEPGYLSVEVTPEVAVDVEVDGVLVAERALRPTRLRVPVAQGPQRVVIAAPGFAPNVSERKLIAGNEVVLSVALRRTEAHIQLVGLDRDAKVTVDRGVVEGDLITGVELGATVQLRVERKGMRPFQRAVEVNDANGVTVEVGKGVALPMGTLFISARPEGEAFVNGRAVAQKRPLAYPPGKYTVVFKLGAREHRTTAVVEAGKRMDVTHPWPREP